MTKIFLFSLSAIMVVSGQERTPATVALSARRGCVGNVAGENFRTGDKDGANIMRSGTIVPLAIARPVKSFVGPTNFNLCSADGDAQRTPLMRTPGVRLQKSWGTITRTGLVQFQPQVENRGVGVWSTALGTPTERAGSIPAPRSNFIDRLATRESHNNDAALGDFDKSIGEFMSRGRFQLSEAAWVDVSADRRRAGLRTYLWRTHAHSEPVAREYARAYLASLAHHFRSSHGHSPTEAQMISLWRHGYSGHRKLSK